MTQALSELETVFEALCGVGFQRTDRGLEQFRQHQSTGQQPRNPDPYFVALSRGKQQRDFLSTEYRHLWVTGEWWGFRQLWVDWRGRRWILPFLLRWYALLPDWLTDETLTEDALDSLLMRLAISEAATP